MASDELIIGLGSDGDNATVHSWKELNRWVEKERAYWAWLVPGDGKTDSHNWASVVQGQWNQIANQLAPYAGGGNPLITAAPFLSPLNINGQLLVSTTREGRLILDIRETAGDVAAAFAYAFLKRHVQINQAADRDMLRGAMLTALPEYGKPAELADRLQRERANTRSQMTDLTKKLEHQDRERAEHFADYFRRGADVASRLVRRRRSSWEQEQIAWQKDSDEAVESIKAVENTYREAMRLQAPVEYWRRKANEHERKEESARRRLNLFFPIVTLLLLFAFYVGGNLIISKSDASKGAPPAALYIVVSGALAFLSTIAFWVGRLFTKLYLSEHHLRNDADERAIMTETYLALTNESAAADIDRQIILNALFRNTTDGIVKDNGPSDLNIQALLSRFLTK